MRRKYSFLHLIKIKNDKWKCHCGENFLFLFLKKLINLWSKIENVEIDFAQKISINFIRLLGFYIG